MGLDRAIDPQFAELGLFEECSIPRRKIVKNAANRNGLRRRCETANNIEISALNVHLILIYKYFVCYIFFARLENLPLDHGNGVQNAVVKRRVSTEHRGLI